MSVALWILNALVGLTVSMKVLTEGQHVAAAVGWLVSGFCVVIGFHEAKKRATAAASLSDGPLCHRCKKEPIAAAWSPTCGEHCWQGLQGTRGGRRCDA